MNTLETLIGAINSKHQISFEYNKSGVITKRVGNPYAIFIYTAKNTKIQSTKVHIVQTGGDSDSIETNPFPSFRMYNIEDLNNIIVLKETFDAPFHKDYKPESDFYKDVIAKV